MIAFVVSVVDQTLPPETEDVNTPDPQKVAEEGVMDTALAG